MLTALNLARLALLAPTWARIASLAFGVVSTAENHRPANRWACLAEARSTGPFPVTPQLAKAGGEYRARTGDLLVANQALSQLS